MKKNSKYLVILIPFFLGTYGLWITGLNVLDSAFTTMTMYTLNYGDSAGNYYVEIARWFAPLLAAGGGIIFIMSLETKIRNWYRNKYREGIAVYGDTIEANVIKEKVGNQLIETTNWDFIPAKKYVLFGTEEENLSFYSKHREKLKNVPVSLKCTNFRAQDLIGDNVKPFNVEEAAARIFWKQSGVYQIAQENGFTMKISIIGFGPLGEAILLKALQDNVFAADQNIEYHIYGDATSFQKKHYCLDKIKDEKFIFYHDNWLDDYQTVEDSAMILVVEQNNILSLIQDLLLTIKNKQICILSPEEYPLDLIKEKERIQVFNWKKEILELEYLFNDVLFDRAMRVNLYYESQDEKNKDKNIDYLNDDPRPYWDDLDSFTKYSNVSAADYHDVRLEMMKGKEYPASLASFSDVQYEELAVLEHIRWCRYHYINNWQYGIPTNGKNKDKEKRIHKNLVPYESLSPKERKKDYGTIDSLFGQDNKNNTEFQGKVK